MYKKTKFGRPRLLQYSTRTVFSNKYKTIIFQIANKYYYKSSKNAFIVCAFVSYCGFDRRTIISIRFAFDIIRICLQYGVRPTWIIITRLKIVIVYLVTIFFFLQNHFSAAYRLIRMSTTFVVYAWNEDQVNTAGLLSRVRTSRFRKLL